tara:strand:+ start:3785 stop:4465 length:681 start_codon:yes stop_codon:yes gene_type:complete
MFQDKKVIIVGPSSYLENKKTGKFIDSFDLVVRINNLHDINNSELVEDLGLKTDIIYFDGSMDQSRFDRYTTCNPKLLKCTYPESEWFFEDRCKTNVTGLKNFFNIDVVNNIMYQNLKCSLDENFKVRPNSGLIAIVDLLKFPIKELYVTGIDFYRNSYSSYHPDYGGKSLEYVKQVFKNGDNGDVHDINKQFMYFKNLFKSESKLKTDNTMLEYIQNIKYENILF